MPESFQFSLHVVAPLVTFLIGGIPFGYLIGRLHGVDLREVGSRNIGATNAARTLGKAVGFVVFALDALKGFLCMLGLAWLINCFYAPWKAQFPSAAELAWCEAGLACVLGHIFSPYLHFRGGKGVATAFGVLLGYWPCMTLTALACFAIWFLILGLTRIVSLASILAASALVPILALVCYLVTGQSLMHIPWLSLMAIITSINVLVSHRSNISRLLRGQELKWTPVKSQPSSEKR